MADRSRKFTHLQEIPERLKLHTHTITCTKPILVVLQDVVFHNTFCLQPQQRDMSSKATAAKVSQSNDLFGPDYAESSSHRAPAQDEGVEKQDPGLEEEEEEEDATENANVNDGEIPGEDEMAANQLEDLYGMYDILPSKSSNTVSRIRVTF